MSFEHAVQSRAGTKCISSALRSVFLLLFFFSGAGLGSQAAGATFYSLLFTHTHQVYIDISSDTIM